MADDQAFGLADSDGIPRQPFAADRMGYTSCSNYGQTTRVNLKHMLGANFERATA